MKNFITEVINLSVEPYETMVTRRWRDL